MIGTKRSLIIKPSFAPLFIVMRSVHCEHVYIFMFKINHLHLRPQLQKLLPNSRQPPFHDRRAEYVSVKQQIWRGQGKFLAFDLTSYPPPY
jgi:hypothetical protein